MNLSEYIQLTIGDKYKMDDSAVELTKAALLAVYEKGIGFNIECAPRLDMFMLTEIKVGRSIFEAVRNDAVRFEFIRAIDTADRELNWKEFFDIYVATAGVVGLTALAISSEIRQHATQSMEDFSYTEEAPSDNSVDCNSPEAKWLNNGVLEADGKSWDLTAELDKDAPAEVQIARIVYSLRDPDTGRISAQMLEGCVSLLGKFVSGERKVAHATIESLQAQVNQVKDKPVIVWPADKDHWIYDPRSSAPCAGIPLSEGEARELMTGILQRAARFAVARASGMGTSRMLNIEGFVDNVVIGVIGHGNEPEAVVGRNIANAIKPKVRK